MGGKLKRIYRQWGGVGVGVGVGLVRKKRDMMANDKGEVTYHNEYFGEM
jgi:hypothetical protein